ncbi:MAG: stalk domain-containing protein [Bacillota bacterium]
MKRTRKAWTRWLIGGAVMALILAPGVARADSVQVVLDGEPLAFDVPPVIEENVTMVPVRAVLTPLGASLSWSPESQTVSATLNETTIEAVVGSQTARVNGQPVPLAMPVLNREGRTLIPLRFFAEELGFAVKWEGESHTVRISSGAAAAAGRESVRTASVSRQATRRVGEMVLARARELVGLPYAWGGSSPETGFDCSGFIVYLAGQIGADMARTSFEQYTVGTAVEQADLAAGDLVFFTTYAPGASHVGVYDGEGGFIHAQSPEVGVVRTAMTNPWWSERYIGARRVFR